MHKKQQHNSECLWKCDIQCCMAAGAWADFCWNIFIFIFLLHLSSSQVCAWVCSFQQRSFQQAWCHWPPGRTHNGKHLALINTHTHAHNRTLSITPRVLRAAVHSKNRMDAANSSKFGKIISFILLDRVSEVGSGPTELSWTHSVTDDQHHEEEVHFLGEWGVRWIMCCFKQSLICLYSALISINSINQLYF